MKKILASCLTCCALLGSMCFSSPLAQVHATETGTKQSSRNYVPIDLNVKEAPGKYTHTISEVLIPGQVIKILDMTNISCSSSNGAGQVDPDDGTFAVDGAQGTFEIHLENTKNNKQYIVKGEVSAAESSPAQTHGGEERPEDVPSEDVPSEDVPSVEPLEIDLSKSADYGAKMGKTEEDKDRTISVKVTPETHLYIDKTTKTLPVGSSFELNLPEKISDNYLDYDLHTRIYNIQNPKIDDEFVNYNNYLDYLKFSDPQDHWKATLLSPIKAGMKVSFQAVAMKNSETGPQADSAENSLVTYQAEPPQEEEYPRFTDPTASNIVFPVELTIVDEGKGDPADDDEINVSLNVTPEYKKLTSKGETYKVDASVEIDEDADQEAKDTFAEMKKDGHFKVLFVSRDTSVATVAEDGTVTAVANGSTEILAYVEGYEDELFGISKVDVEIPAEVAEDNTSNSAYPKTGDNFMAVSAAILTLGLSALVVAFMSKKQKNVNEEK